MKNKAIGTMMGLMLAIGLAHSQIDTIPENFNGICEQTTTPGRTYSIDYTGTDGVEWKIKTLYSSSSWWGGIDDEGNSVSGTVHCGSLQWDESGSGYAKAYLLKGITSLSFQVRYGFQLVGGYVRVLVDGVEIGLTEVLADKDVHSYTFPVNTPGPLDLELIYVAEGSTPGGIIVDNLKIVTTDASKPFFRVDKLEEYDSYMDTLQALTDTIEIFFYAEHCLMINGEFVDYFDMSDDAEFTMGSVVDLNPGDSCNLYYWGSVVPGTGSTGGEPTVGVYLPVNTNSDSMKFVTTSGEDAQEGTLSFINGNVDYDLIVFKLTDLKHEYRIRYAYDYYPASTTGIKDKSYKPSVEFYPNPVQNHAWFKTSKELVSFEVFDVNGRSLLIERNPEMTGEGHYRLNLESLDTGIWIVRFLYTDNSMDAVRVMVE